MRNLNTGFTMLEVLIALLVIAVGILGHSSLQLRTADIAQRSSYAQTANIALLDLAQRIRSNSAAAISGDFNENNLSSGNALATYKNCISDTSCSESEFAKFEVGKWYTTLDEKLPFPRFSVNSATSGTGTLVTILLTWDAGRSGSGFTSCTGNAECQSGSLSIWLR